MTTAHDSQQQAGPPSAEALLRAIERDLRGRADYCGGLGRNQDGNWLDGIADRLTIAIDAIAATPQQAGGTHAFVSEVGCAFCDVCNMPHDDPQHGGLVPQGGSAEDSVAKIAAEMRHLMTGKNTYPMAIKAWAKRLESFAASRLDAATPAPCVDSGEKLGPIDHDESYDRYYIPLPGGWEVQTKGRGSSFRICNTKTGERMNMTGFHLEHDMIEKMAREIHAALAASPSHGTGESL